MSKNEADDVKKISTSFLKKHDYFTGWRSGTMTWTTVAIARQCIRGQYTLRVESA
jgi:hypothetical protein